MSVKATTWAWEQDVNMAEQLTLLALADFADEKGVCWPSKELLMQRSKLSRRGLMSCLKRLADAGLISVQQWHRENGSSTSNYYQLCMPEGRGQEMPPRRERGRGQLLPPSRKEAGGGGTSCPLEGAPPAPPGGTSCPP